MNSLPGSSLDLRDRQLSEVDSPAAWRRLGFVVAVGTIGSVGMWFDTGCAAGRSGRFRRRPRRRLAALYACDDGLRLRRRRDGTAVRPLRRHGRAHVGHTGARPRLWRCRAGAESAHVRADALGRRRRRLGELRAADGRYLALVRAPPRHRGRDRGLRQLYRRHDLAAGGAACDRERRLARTPISASACSAYSPCCRSSLRWRRAPAHPIVWISARLVPAPCAISAFRPTR